MSNEINLNEMDAARTTPVIGEEKHDFTKILEICFWVLFDSVKFLFLWSAFFVNLLKSAVDSVLDEMSKYEDSANRFSVSANKKDHWINRNLAILPSAVVRTPRHADVDEIVKVFPAEVELVKCVGARRTAGCLEYSVNSELDTLSCTVVPQNVAETRNVATPRPDTIDDTFKYWKKRYSLFSRFDEGVLLDEESFYSVCPEILSKFMADQCKSSKIVVDPFCGAGGNIIQLAKLCDKVIACDIDERKIKMAKHNAAVYGVSHKIQFIVGDFFDLCHSIKADAIVTSPPWGGPSYTVKSIIGPSDILLDRILEAGKSVAPKMLLHLPKNLSKSECERVCQNTGLRAVKLENIFINKYLNCVLAYVKSNTSNCRDSPRITDARFHEPFYKHGQDSGKSAFRDYLRRVERSMEMC